MKRTALFFCFIGLLLSGASAQNTAQAPSLVSLRSLNAAPDYPDNPPFQKPVFGASDYDDYGGKLGIGISILSGFGVPVRYYLNPKDVLELGMYTGGVVLYEEGTNEIESVEYGFMAGLGYTHFGNRFLKEKKKRNKVRAHGVALRANRLFGDFSSTFASLGWAMETFKENRPGNSFIFELGLQALFPDFVYEGVRYDEPRPGIYLRCHWNFFVD